MINGYTESEICMLYRDAKKKDRQIKILTELTGLREFEIMRILEEGGYLVADIEKLKELHANGLSGNAIAKELGLTSSTVYYHLEKLGLKSKGKRKKEEKKTVEKEANYDVIQKLEKETRENIEELKAVLPKSIPDEDDLPINYELADGALEKVTAQQYYELAKITLQLLKLIWEG